MSEDRIKTIGRYEIEREIGRGGMAVVYKAHDPHLDRAVAIKLIRKGAFTGDQLETLPERFRREARALAKLDHANIVKVLDYGEHEGATYLVMEYLEGVTLKEVRKPLRVEAAVRLIRPIAEALDYVHDHGILHRDVKPSNIMITRNKKIMLTDFGIAKWLEDENDQYTLTAAGVGIGTPEYMAPEQGLGKKIDARADAYSLSVVFYELITGRKPFQGETALETLTKQASEPFPDPRTYVPELNESVKRFLDRALAKKPEDRYPTMKDYLRDLDGLRLQSLAQASSGQTGIQTVRSSEPATDSSIRFGKTDMRKVREAAAAVGDQPQHPSTAAENRKWQTETVEDHRRKRAASAGPNRRRWMIPAVGFLMMLAVWVGIQSRTGKLFVTRTPTAGAITSDIWGTQTAMTVARTQSTPIKAAEETPIMQETAQAALMQVADILTSIQTQTKIKIDESKKNKEAAEAVLQREATVTATIGLAATAGIAIRSTAAVQTVIAEKQRAAEEAMSRTATEAAFQYAATELAAAGLTATADVAILSTKIAQTVIAENRFAAEEMSNQTATAEQKTIYSNETLTALNQRLTETKAAVRISDTPTPSAAAAVAIERVSEECEPWPTSKTPEALFSFYGNRINTNINPNRILGAMAVVKPPENAIGKDWEISVSDYSDKLPAKIHASVRYACSLISANLHCGPFDYLYVDNHHNANLSFDSFKSLVHVYPKGMDCEVYTAEISYHLFDQVRNSIGSGGAGQNSGNSAVEEESSSAPGPSGGSEPGAYDISP